MPSATKSNQSNGQHIAASKINRQDPPDSSQTSAEEIGRNAASPKGLRTVPKYPAKSSPSSSTGSRRYRLKRKARPWIHVALLPFFYIVFVLLHLVFWLGTSLPSFFRWIDPRRNKRSRWTRQVQTSLWNLGDGCRGGASLDDLGTPAFRVPQHLAVLIPSTPPPTGSLLFHLICDGLSQLYHNTWRLLSTTPSTRKDFKSYCIKSRRDWTHHQACDALHRFECLQSILQHAAMSGVPVVSLWDDHRSDGQGFMQSIEKDKRYNRKSHSWDLSMTNVERRLTLHVDVWDHTRRRSNHDSTIAMNGTEFPHSTHSPTLTIKLNILTPHHDGRNAFASISESIASQLIQADGETSLTQDKADHQVSTAMGQRSHSMQCRVPHLSRRADSLSVADVDAALAEDNYPTAEPDCLLSVSQAYPSRTIGDFPRWAIRITEICHTKVDAQAYTILDFWDMLRQFTKAEQRYGR